MVVVVGERPRAISLKPKPPHHSMPSSSSKRDLRQEGRSEKCGRRGNDNPGAGLDKTDHVNR